MSNLNPASGFNFIGGSRYVEQCQCDGPGCDFVGTCLPVADGVYCVDCYQAAQDAVTDEMDEHSALCGEREQPEQEDFSDFDMFEDDTAGDFYDYDDRDDSPMYENDFIYWNHYADDFFDDV